MDIVSRAHCIDLPRPGFSGHIHLFLAGFSCATGHFCQLQHSAPSVFARPDDLRAVAVQVEPSFAVAHRDLFFAQLDRGLAVAIQPVRRGVAAEQGSKRNPKLQLYKL